MSSEPTKGTESLELEIFWASNTEETYRSDWTDFWEWCISQDKEPLPANAGIVGAYLLELRVRKLRASTIRRRAVAVGPRTRLLGTRIRNGKKGLHQMT